MELGTPTAEPLTTNLAVSPAAPNTLDVPVSIREYINEKGQGRSFNLESFKIRHLTEPNHIVVDLSIGPKGAELLEPFQVSLVLGDAAARQLAQAITQLVG